MREVPQRNMEKNKKVRNRILTSIVSLFLVVTIGICLFVVVQVLSNGHVSFWGYSFFRVVTGSMEPSISVGELLLTQKDDISDVEIGDVISFRSQSPDMIGSIITHRVVQITKDEAGNALLLTKGDNNLSVDAYYVSKSNYVGTVIWNSGDSLLSGILNFFSNKFGFLSCIAFPCLLIATLVLRDNVNKIKKDIECVVDELENIKTTSVNNSKEKDKQTEDYEQMRERIRAELIEELKQSDDSEQSK